VNKKVTVPDGSSATPPLSRRVDNVSHG
jgi:hypothetical protein